MSDPHASRFASCLPFGAQLCRADDSGTCVHFRLWAPRHDAVVLEYQPPGADERTWLDMKRAGPGWFEGFVACGPGTRYRYLLGGTHAIPDPASRAQPEGPRGPSEVVDPRAYLWQHTHWRGRPWEEIVLYAIDPGAAGGYHGVRERLPQLVRLGVTALQLMAPTPTQSGGLPFAPNAACGGPEALKALIDAAHGAGLAVLIDCDYPRFGQGGATLRKYVTSYFETHDAAEIRAGMPAALLDFAHAEVREFFCENARYWIDEYRCDGLCLQHADRIGDAWLREFADTVRETLPVDRFVHLMLGSERHPVHLADTHFDAQANDGGERALYRLTGRAARAGESEVSAHQSIHALARALAADGNAYRADTGEPLPATALVLSDGATRDLHDGRDAACAALALSLLTPQIPLLFAEAAREPERRSCVQSALAVRARLITPRVANAQPATVTMLGAHGGAHADALIAAWRLADEETLSIALNLSAQPIPLAELPPGRIVFETRARARDELSRGELPAHTLVAWLTGDVNGYALAHDARRIETDTGVREAWMRSPLPVSEATAVIH